MTVLSKNLQKGEECNRADLLQPMQKKKIMTGYDLFWYLLGVKVTWDHAHKTRSWHLLGFAFKKSNKHPGDFYMRVPPPSRVGVMLYL